jgi:hypothetical protein
MCRFTASYTPAVLIILAVILAPGCAKKENIGNLDSGLNLSYRMKKDEVLGYRTTVEMVETGEMMGQSMSSTMSSSTLFSVVCTEPGIPYSSLRITIDAMELKFTGPMKNETSPDLTRLSGMSFTMNLSGLGKETEIQGADTIRYSLGTLGERSATTGFQTFFPDLPGRPVRAGDTWTSCDTLSDDTGGMVVYMILENTHTAVAIQETHGKNMTKVTTEVTGLIETSGMQGGTHLDFRGDVEGEETWYFDHIRGDFHGTESNSIVKGTATVKGPQEITIPIERRIKIVSTLEE